MPVFYSSYRPHWFLKDFSFCLNFCRGLSTFAFYNIDSLYNSCSMLPGTRCLTCPRSRTGTTRTRCPTTLRQRLTSRGGSDGDPPSYWTISPRWVIYHTTLRQRLTSRGGSDGDPPSYWTISPRWGISYQTKPVPTLLYMVESRN